LDERFNHHIATLLTTPRADSGSSKPTPGKSDRPEASK
jgi:hypothetical protein